MGKDTELTITWLSYMESYRCHYATDFPKINVSTINPNNVNT